MYPLTLAQSYSKDELVWNVYVEYLMQIQHAISACPAGKMQLF